MNQEVKDKWIAALESGEFTQGKRFLHTRKSNGQETHCCLGVLCELAYREGVVTRELQEEFVRGGGRQYLYGFSGYSALPEEVLKWAGLHSRLPTVPMAELGLGNHGLAHLNDGAGYTFSDIAIVIKEHL